jgi:hypothetical protein
MTRARVALVAVAVVADLDVALDDPVAAARA